MHGVGKNGKSTLVEVFQDLMGDYSTTTNPDVVMRHRTGDATAQYALAELKGVRLVSVSETKRSVELKEAVVKQITGSDTISAHAPYGRPFYYRPQFKLWLLTNHKPEMPDGSEAIWDRLRLIPFKQRFEGKGADKKLPEKLREELSGVLAWAVRGCVEWGHHGLGSAAVVERATAEYRAETDIIERFFEAVCVFGPEYRVPRKDLFEAYEAWCLENGEGSLSQNMFSRVISERGVVKNFGEGKVHGIRIWKGIGLQKVPPNPPFLKKCPPRKSPANTGVVKRLGGTFLKIRKTFLRNPLHERGFRKTATKKCPPTKKVPPMSSPPPSRGRSTGTKSTTDHGVRNDRH